MSHKGQTPSTKGRTRRRRKGHKPSGVAHSMIAAKPSNIPLPTEDQDKKNNLVKWGNKNEYPYFLNYLFKNNSIHAGIIRAKRYFTVSGGLEYTGTDQAKYDEFFKNKKKSYNDKDLEALVSDISLDYEKSNMGCFKVIFSKVGDRVYKKIEVIPFERIRYEILQGEDGDFYLTGNIHVSVDWLDSKTQFETLHPYDANDDKQRECFVLFQEESGQSLDTPDATKINPAIYPDPPYGGAITDIDTGIQVGIYNNSEIHNGFVLGSMLYLANGAPKNDDDKRRLERDIGDSSTGPTQAGRTLVLYGNGQDGKPEVIALNGNNLADRYENTKKGSEDSTIHGHQVVVPTLFGKKPEGSFNASELETGYAIMQANYFTARRDTILSALNWIMNVIAQIPGEINFGEVELNLPKEEVNPQFQVNLSEQKQQEDSDKIFDRLKMLGTDKNQYEVLHSISLNDRDPISKEEMVAAFKETFAGLTDLQQQTLNLINEGQGYNSIRKALDISSLELTRIYQDLTAQDLIDNKGTMTTQGKKQVAISEIEKMEIMFEYRERPDAPALVPGGKSREFCTELLRLNRLYSREDINRISGVEGYNVFAYRGGWYHNPNSGKNEPGCRHEWAQVITFK